MSDDKNATPISDETPEPTSTAATNAEPAETQELRATLKANFGLTDVEVEAIIGLGVDSIQELAEVISGKLLTADDLVEAGVRKVPARQIVSKYAPVSTPATSATPLSDVATAGDEKIASALGLDSDIMTTMMMFNLTNSAGMPLDVSGLVPVERLVSMYNPLKKDFAYMLLDKIQEKAGGPIIAINANGSINAEVTQMYIKSLEDGYPLAEDDIFFVDDKASFELIKVGADAQHIRDADPLFPDQPLQLTEMGSQRISWKGISLAARQVVYYAANETGELSSNDYQWLRDNLKPGMSHTDLGGKYPLALQKYNEEARKRSLNPLTVEMKRGPRRTETMSRRRTHTPKGGTGSTGGTFRPFGGEGDDE